MKLEFAFVYEPDLVAGVEDARRVLLDFYLSADLGHAIQTVKPGLEPHHVSFEIVPPTGTAIGQPFIEPDSGLTIRAFTASTNDSGEACMVGAGSTFVPSTVLLNNRENVDTGLLDLVVQNAANYQTKTVPRKGGIRLIIQQTSFPQGRNPIRAPNRYSYVPENRDFIVQTLSQYMERAGAVYSELKPTFPAAQGLRLPMWAFGHCQVPGVAFAAPRAQTSPEAWWSQTARVALQRFRPDAPLEDSLKWFLSSAPTDTEVMTIAALMHTAVVSHNSTYASDGVYVTDKNFAQIKGQARVNNNATRVSRRLITAGTERLQVRAFEDLKPVRHVAAAAGWKPIGAAAHSSANPSARFVSMEDFSLGLVRRVRAPEWGCDAASDCEDDAAEIALQAIELRNRTDFRDPVLLKLQAVRQHYLICQVLFYVNGQQISDENAPLGGHAAALYCSTDYVLDMVERYNMARPVFEGLQRRAAPVPADYRQFPVITLEGTGLMWPVGDDARQQQTVQNITYLEATTSARFARERFMMPHSRSQRNRFYNTVSSVMPLEFADRYSNIEHIAVQMGGSAPTLGVAYLDFVQGKATNALCPTAPMTEDELLLTKSILKHRYPLVGYAAPVSTQSRPNPHLAAVVKFCHTQNRLAKLGAAQKSLQQESFYLRYSQINEAVTKNYCAEIRLKNRIVNFTYAEENLGPEGWGGYRVTFHIAP